MKIAIVYDWIDKWGGVERALLRLHDLYPEAEFYTSYVDYEKAPWARKLSITTSFLQNFPNFIKKSRIFSLIFFTYIFESFDFTEYDLVISVTSSFAKGVITKPGTAHICYLLTPTRYLWVMPDTYLKNPVVRSIASYFMAGLRAWDYVAAQRPDALISISNAVAARCDKFYKRSSQVIYPPFDIKYWTDIRSKIKPLPLASVASTGYYLVVARLEEYKRVDIAIEAFNVLGKNLIVVGTGSQGAALSRQAGKTVQFIEKATDEELARLYTEATALIMSQEEDFGYVSLEAQFFGCPVVAYRKGGVVETVIEGETGVFFDEQSTPCLVDTVERFQSISYNIKQSTIAKGVVQCERFSTEKFENALQKIIANINK